MERGVELTLSLVEVKELQAQECMIQLANQRDINLVRHSESRQAALSADQELLLMSGRPAAGTFNEERRCSPRESRRA